MRGLNIDQWAKLSSRASLSPRLHDTSERLAELVDQLGEAPGPLAGVLSASLPQRWTEVARRSLREKAPLFEWESPSTLVGAGPTSLPEADLMAIGERQARTRGASRAVPLYPAPGSGGLHWSYYQEWFGLAQAIDQEALQAVAFYNPSTATRTALRVGVPEVISSYDEEKQRLELVHGSHSVLVDVEAFSFMGLVRGFLPEQVLAVAVRHGAARLQRLDRFFDRAQAKVGAQDVRFFDNIPVLLLGDRLIIDPVAGKFLEDGTEDEEHDELLTRAAEETFATRCTCLVERIQPVLRPKSETLSSSRSGNPASDCLLVPLGSAHHIVYELACPHTNYRPTAAEWMTAGWSADRCKSEWLKRPIPGELAVARTTTAFSSAVLVHGAEIGALAGSTMAVSSLARALGFAPGARLAMYVPNANLMFLTNERMGNGNRLRGALESGNLATILEREACPLGPTVDYLGQVKVEAVTPLHVRIRRLELRPRRAGRSA